MFQFLELRRDSVIFRNDRVRVLQTGARLVRYHVPVFGTETRLVVVQQKVTICFQCVDWRNELAH